MAKKKKSQVCLAESVSTRKTKKVERIVANVTAAGAGLGGISSVSHLDPRPDINAIAVLLRAGKLDVAKKKADEFAGGNLSVPVSATMGMRDDLDAFLESREMLRQAVHVWDVSNEDSVTFLLDSIEECVIQFSRISVGLLSLETESVENLPDALLCEFDEFDDFIESHVADVEKRMAELRKENEDEEVKGLMADLIQKAEASPGIILVVCDFESEADFHMLKPEHKNAGISLAQERKMRSRLISEMRKRGYAIVSRMLNTSSYLRWLAKTGKKHTATNMSAFICLPEAGACTTGATDGKQDP